ncbi:MAG: nuclear transport factor 2 family protein [Pseudomonadota bacterium]|nr:nuclear transport factor 2 family protein [Pseudomonadota bacterium]
MIRNNGVGQIPALYDSLLAGDDAAATFLLDDASLLHLPGRSGLAGDYQGQEAILGLLRRTAQLTRSVLHFNSPTVVSQVDQLIVLLGHMRATHMGRQLATDALHVLSLKDGKIREVWIFSLNQNQFDAFWTGCESSLG